MLQGGNEMRKNLKKVLSIVMILTMVFAMSATAFANTSSTNDVTVNLVFQQEEVDLGLGESISVPGTHTRLYTAPNSTDDMSLLVPNTKTSVMDATLWYLDSIECYDATENALTWYREPLQKEDGTWYVKNWGGQIESMFATPNERTNSVTDTEWWKGYAWIVSINGVESDNFATNVEVANGMTITWNYKYVEKNLNEMA